MLMTVIYLMLISRLPCSITLHRSCVPNTQFLLNGRLCYCNNKGQLDDASCRTIGRRQVCKPGQIIWEECSQCICQENGKRLCTNTECTHEAARNKSRAISRSGSAVWCTPFRSYYVNCTLCVCPASGKMSEAKCATDSSCALKDVYTSLDTLPQNICIPKVMYLFTCLHCLCSDDGVFLKSQCIETCHKPPESARRCLPKSFYKADCNICRCLDNGIPEDSICSKSVCKQPAKLTTLNSLRNATSICAPNKYTKPKCIYCECNEQGIVNEQACLEHECLKIDDFKYDSVKTTCTLGEMVPTCMECFCPRSNLTLEQHCTTVCSPQNKLAVLENVLKDKVALIDRTLVKETARTDSCDPNSLFLDQGRYCLCSDDGNTNSILCTSVLEDTLPKKPSTIFDNRDIPRKVQSIPCEPNTYVEYDCNSCYCTKSGQIDTKWCTSDDCDAKKVIFENNNKARVGTSKMHNGAEPTTCSPGSISKVNCNFCICGSSGLLSDRACTKNTCSGTLKTSGDEFSCEPSAYYTVDCNMCFCPSDGIKNVEKCTKNQCETNFLRSDACTAGALFSDDCNICVCPPNGDKTHKVCTNRTCSENDTPWKKIFKISQTLLNNQVGDKTHKTFEPCYPGEEFEMGCKVCLCPEVGLRAYASCTSMLCDDQSTATAHKHQEDDEDRFIEDLNENPVSSELGDGRRQYEDMENCRVYNLTDSSERNECTPGSEYILKCRVCVCPYMGSVSQFCREMPEDRYCEQAFPGYNYVPMGRRNQDGNYTYINGTSIKKNYPITIYVPHNHTKYKCDALGKIENECYLCECEDGVMIREHCYKSDADNCTEITWPSFIKSEDKIDKIKL